MKKLILVIGYLITVNEIISDLSFGGRELAEIYRQKNAYEKKEIFSSSRK